MTRLMRLCTTTVLATQFIGTAVFADITAQEVWTGWHDELIDAGYEVQFDETMSGGILTINNLEISKTSSEDQTKSALTIGPIGLLEHDDGTVEVILAQDMQVVYNSGVYSFTVDQRQTGLHYVISGNVNAMTQSIQADEILLSLSEMTEDDAPLENAKIDLTLTGLSATTFLKEANLIEVASEFALDALTYDIAVKKTQGTDDSVVWNGSFTDLRWDTDVAIPDNIETATFPEAIATGFQFKFAGSFGALISAFSFSEEGTRVNGTANSNGSSLSIEMKPGSERQIDLISKLALGDLSIDVDGTTEDNEVKVHTAMADINGAFEMTLPENFETDSMPEALDAGLALNTNYSHGKISANMSFHGDRESMDGSMSIRSGDMFLGFDRNSVQYGGSAIDTKVSADIGEPFPPMEYSLGETLFNIKAPMQKTNEPQPFIFQYKLVDLLIDDAIWDLVDPKALLSREAASVIVDMTAMGEWLLDPLAPETINDDFEDKGLLHGLTVSALQVNGAGAAFSGAGDFTFDNDDLTTFDGIPAPEGTFDFRISGGNGLIDNLIELGLLGKDEALGARMVIGLLTVAGEDDDTLVSAIEVTEDGKISANGQRLK